MSDGSNLPVRFEASARTRDRRDLGNAGAVAVVIAGVLWLGGGIALIPAAAVGAAGGAIPLAVWLWRARRLAVAAVEVSDEALVLELSGGRLPIPWSDVRRVIHSPYGDESWTVTTAHATHLILAEGMTRDDRDQLTDAFVSRGLLGDSDG